MIYQNQKLNVKNNHGQKIFQKADNASLDSNFNKSEKNLKYLKNRLRKNGNSIHTKISENMESLKMGQLKEKIDIWMLLQQRSFH